MIEILASIQWTTVLASAISAAVVGVVVGGAQFITNRYLSKILDRIEREVIKNETNRNGSNKS